MTARGTKEEAPTMRPIQEQAWKYDGWGGLLVDGEKVATMVPGHGAKAQAIAAVPDMVRALLDLTAVGHTTESLGKALTAGRAALAKAGAM